MSIPTVVQHTLTQSNETIETGNDFEFPIPELTLPNNCLILIMGYVSGSTLSSITAGSNTWSNTPNVTETDTSNSYTLSGFVLPNTTSGAGTCIVSFSAPVTGFVASFIEVNNIATASPLDGSQVAFGVGAGGAGTQAISSGSFSTTVDGDLIIHVVLDTNNGAEMESGIVDGVTKFTKGSGYTLLQTELTNALAVQYQVQSTHGATNPSISVTDTVGNGGYISMTFALKAATSGTAPSATPRKFGVMHSRIVGNGSTGNKNYPYQFPSVGNTLVQTVTTVSNSIVLVGVSGSVSGTWNPVTTNGEAGQACYKTSATSSTDDLLTVTLNDSTDNEYVQGMTYDIIGSGVTFDQAVNSVGGTTFGPGNSTPAVSLTPGTNTGFVIAAWAVFSGPPDSVVTPSGAQFLSCTYTGESDFSRMDVGDFHAFYTYSTNAAQSWVFHNTVSTTGYGALLVSFSVASGGAGPAPPTVLPKQVYVMP